MNNQESEAAVELANRRTEGKPGPLLADKLRPRNFDEAFGLQQSVGRLFAGVSASEVAGWKCAVPNEGKFVLGALYESTLQFESNAEVSPCMLYADSNGQALVEPELAFELKHDLPSREEPYRTAEIDDAIAKTRLALELIQSRYDSSEQASFWDALADGLVNQGVWFGPELPAEFNGDLAEFQLTIKNADAQLETKTAKHPSGNPRSCLYWLVNFLSEQGIGLRKGQRIITGSYAGVLKLPIGQKITLSYGDLGKFTIQFEAK